MNSPALRRYNKRVAVCSALYAVFLIGATYGFRHHVVSGPSAWIAAVLPALSIIGIFATLGRYLVEEDDEYLRMLMVRQMLWASGFALSIATLWGFLEAYDLVHHVASYSVAILWFLGLGLGSLANRLTIGRAS